MINELLKDLDDSNYRREYLIDMLGQPTPGGDPEHRISWTLADCDFSYYYCLCRVNIYLEHDRLVDAQEVCD